MIFRSRYNITGILNQELLKIDYQFDLISGTSIL